MLYNCEETTSPGHWTAPDRAVYMGSHVTCWELLHWCLARHDKETTKEKYILRSLSFLELSVCPHRDA